MNPDLSVVIPAYNEEGCLEELCRRLAKVLDGAGLDYEILFVDDGSGDGTFEELRAIADKNPAVRALRFSRNFGHQAALAAGMTHARGAAVATMDADLQHPPEMLPDLIAKWREGYEVVCTIREETAGAASHKNLSSGLFYRLINMLSPTPIIPGAADFRLLDRKAVDALNSMPERTRFLRGLVPWIGFRQAEISFSAPERFAGKSKFGYRKMLKLALHGILSLSATPLRFATLVGACVVGIAALYAVYVVWTWGSNEAVEKGWASIQLLMLFLGGAQIFFMGVIGEYLARVFEEVKGRPLYLIAEEIGDSKEEE